MGSAALSFEIQTSAVERVVQEFEQTLLQVEKPAAALVFCSGEIGSHLQAIGEALHALAPQLPVTLLSGPGVLSERGELEEVSAATGMIWRGGNCRMRLIQPESEATLEALEALLEPEAAEHRPTLLFIRSEGFDPHPLWEVRRRFNSRRIFGAGTFGEPGIVCSDAQGVRAATAAALQLEGLNPPNIRTAHSCRLLDEPMPITSADGCLVLEIAGKPALEVLEQMGSELEGQPLLFTVLAEPRDDDRATEELLVRGIQGIDPDKKALLVSEEIKDGMYITFGVRDPVAARLDMDALCRKLGREIAGAAPRFSLYFNCTGRGQSLHGTPNVDTRVLRERFGEVPLAGFHSAFEIAPFGSGPALQLYTGVLAMFSAPS